MKITHMAGRRRRLWQAAGGAAGANVRGDMSDTAMSNLKRRIERSEYTVDPRAVAAEMVWRLRLVTALGPVLGPADGRTREPAEGDRSAPSRASRSRRTQRRPG